ncbi:MAG: flavin reductase family protein [Bacteroidales bacterium]|nr:flavin reductase family protein [Bacteroidales bacterium]
MKKTLFLCAVATLILAACQPKNQQTNDNNISLEDLDIKDVSGRVNFGGENPLITPQPALMIATYDAMEIPDVMMAAWGGQCGSNLISFNLSSHKTMDNLRLKRAFTISFASRANVVESDYFGIVSGNKVPDKVSKAGFTATKSPNVDAPIINEYPLTLECRVVDIIEHENGGAYVIGEVLNMSADESVLTDGKIDYDKLQPLIYESSTKSYRAIGEVVGQAWGSGRAIMEK